MSEFRIEYTIQRSEDGAEFAEIGFGASGTWDTLAAASCAVESDIQNHQWETSGDMPDPSDVEVGDTFRKALDRKVATRTLREFIEEADASPAVTWGGHGGIKELAIRRHNRIDAARLLAMLDLAS